jgi:hypothetical protein
LISRRDAAAGVVHSRWLRSPRTTPRASASTLNSSPISCSLISSCCACRLWQRGRGQQLRQAAVEQEVRLRGVAQHVEPGILRGQRDGAEVDVRGDVLQPTSASGSASARWPRWHISVPPTALRVVVLGSGKP